MRRLRAWLVRFGGLFGKQRRDRDLAEELEANLQMHIEDNVRSGMTPDEARREALIKLGGLEQTKEACRDRRSLPWLDTLAQDLQLAVRVLARNPKISAVIVVILGLGIGLNTAIFSVVNAVLLRPLPYPQPERLIQIQKEWQPPWLQAPEVTSIFGLYATEVVAWENENQVLAQIAAYEGAEASLTGSGEGEMVHCLRATASFLPLLGASPAVGRGFLPEEQRHGGPRAVVLSHGFWQRHFGGDTHALGRSLILDEQSYTIIGVLAAGFRFTEPFDLCVALPSEPQGTGAGAWVRIIGRLKPGVNQEQARSALDGIYQRVADVKEHGKVVLTSLQDYLAGDSKLSLLVYLGAMAFVLLIACANVANLLLARAVHRRKEAAIRAALGAGWWQLIRQLLTESIVLALLGAGLGLVLAYWGKNLIQVLIVHLPTVSAIQMDGRVMAFALSVGLLTGLGFGLAPAIVASQVRPGDALKEGSGGSRANGHQRVLSRLLVVAEVALALVLLVGAGLLLKNFLHLRTTQLGFGLDRTLSLRIVLSNRKYPDARSQATYFKQVIERLRAVPGVEAVGADNALPLGGFSSSITVVFASGKPNVGFAFACVNADYFRAMEIPLKKGRWFTDQDCIGAPAVAVVNERFAETRFSSEDALGKEVMPSTRIIGVVGDVCQFGPKRRPDPLVYFSYLQKGKQGMNLAVRARSNPLKLAGVIRSQILSIDHDQTIKDVMTLEQRLAGLLAPERLNTQLSGLLGALALGLAVIGIYGILSFSVAERTHEIGVRMALGAQPFDVLRLVLREGLILTVGGVFFGLLAAYWLTWYIGIWLYDVTVHDLSTFIAVPVFLVLVAMLACWLPARRAAKVDPIVALRYE